MGVSELRACQVKEDQNRAAALTAESALTLPMTNILACDTD